MKNVSMMVRRLTQMGRQEEGQSMIEYGLIIALVAVAVVGTLTLLGPKIAGLFTNVMGSL